MEIRKKIVETILLIKSTIYLLILGQNSMIFKENPKSLMESYFTGELRLGVRRGGGWGAGGGSLFTSELELGES